MKTLLASLAFASAASAAPTSNVIFAVDHKVKAEAPGLETSHFELRTNGVWTFVVTKDGDGAAQHGRLSTKQLRKVRALLADAPWTTSASVMMCAAISNDFTEYTVAGRLVWRHEMCVGDMLDAKSTKDLDAALAVLRSVTGENF